MSVVDNSEVFALFNEMNLEAWKMRHVKQSPATLVLSETETEPTCYRETD